MRNLSLRIKWVPQKLIPHSFFPHYFISHWLVHISEIRKLLFALKLENYSVRIFLFGDTCSLISQVDSSEINISAA